MLWNKILDSHLLQTSRSQFRRKGQAVLWKGVLWPKDSMLGMKFLGRSMLTLVLVFSAHFQAFMAVLKQVWAFPQMLF